MSDGAPPPGDARPPRRARYRGTHPRHRDERYKELNPGAFPAEQVKVLARGHTPAGTHVPIMVAGVLAALAPRPGEIMLDCTLGYGGHAAELARAVLPGGRVIGLDVDADELARTQARMTAAALPVTGHHASFAEAATVLAAEGLAGVDGLLADLGVSSMQLDHEARGFSFKHDGPLDMRMDRSRGVPVREWLTTVSEADLAAALADLADEPDADEIAAAIKRRAATRPLRTTRDLVTLVLTVKGFDDGHYRKENARDHHPAARTFQALRMALNREVGHLGQLLRALPWLLNPGGRAAIITFHSGEARRVSEALAAAQALGHLTHVCERPLVPDGQEIRDNPRARSARLYTANRG